MRPDKEQAQEPNAPRCAPERLEKENDKLTSLNSQQERQTAAALYALGALSLHEARILEQRLAEAGQDLRQDLVEFEAVVATLALSAAEQTPAPALRAALRKRVAAEAEPQTSPQASGQFINLRADEGRWVEVGPGVQVKRLFVDQVSGNETSLFKFAPGVSVPYHRHRGFEQCYILEGDFRVNELCFGPGDFHVALPGSAHETIGSETGALVLIVAPENYDSR